MTVSKVLMRKAFMLGAQATGLSLLSRPLLGGMGGILMLHRVGDPIHASGTNAFLSLAPTFLDHLLASLKREGSLFISLDETIDRIKSGHKDQRFLSITLDDGYRDNFDAALPVFQKHETPFTVFACPGFIEGKAHLWWEILAKIIDQQQRIAFQAHDGPGALDCATMAEKRTAYEQLIQYLTHEVDELAQRQFVLDLANAYGINAAQYTRDAIMSWKTLRQIAADPLCTIGAHTMCHYHMARLERNEALDEAVTSADVLEMELGERPRHFAFPYGGALAAGRREVDIAREAGFESAVTTRHGLLHKQHANHLHALPRVSLNGNYQQVHYVRTMLSGITVPVSNRGRAVVTY